MGWKILLSLCFLQNKSPKPSLTLLMFLITISCIPLAVLETKAGEEIGKCYYFIWVKLYRFKFHFPWAQSSAYLISKHLPQPPAQASRETWGRKKKPETKPLTSSLAFCSFPLLSFISKGHLHRKTILCQLLLLIPPIWKRNPFPAIAAEIWAACQHSHCFPEPHLTTQTSSRLTLKIHQQSSLGHQFGMPVVRASAGAVVLACHLTHPLPQFPWAELCGCLWASESIYVV